MCDGARVGAEPIDVPPGDLTRRAVLATAAAGVLGGVLAAGPARAATAVAPAAVALDPRRAATYRRLVGVLHGAPDPRFARLPARGATEAFAAWYAEQDPCVREHADAVLDHRAAGPAPACADLRRAAPPQAAAVLAAGVALAAVGCDPPPDEDERPAVPALGVPA